MIRKYTLLMIMLLCGVSGLWAQHNTSSPYTRYGYGNVLDGGFGQTRAMGGLSYGLRDKSIINPNNPASYTAIDSLTFRMEAGVSFQVSRFDGVNEKKTERDGNLEFLAFQFPIRKWVAFSCGLMPYSIVGYEYEQSQTVPSSITGGYLTNTYRYEGKGGITQLYAGLAFRPVKYVSLGGNFQFNFGEISHYSTTSFQDNGIYKTTMDRNFKVKDVTGDFGLQVEVPIKEKHSLSVGGVFQMKSQMSTEATQTIVTSDTTVLNFNNNFDTPMYFGAGFVYTYLEEFMFGVDYKREAWSDVRFFGEKNFEDRSKLSLGAQYLPSKNGRAYFQRVAYRLGASFSSSYYKVNGEQLKFFSLSTGWGFPLKKGLNPTVINLSFEYGHNGEIKDNQLREQYFKFTLNATVNERWFVKRKLN